MSSKGRGLNSIPIRFALMGGGTGGLAVAGLWRANDAGLTGVWLACTIGLAVFATALVPYFAARKLTSQIAALRDSTEALVSGDYDAPVNVDCACEVGDLADSFRKMAQRLNNNIWRMNVLAYTDGVTGLPNRTVIYHLLTNLTTTSEISCATIQFIDLDGFKRVNDMHGHDVGDELLRQVSHRIAKALGQCPERPECCITPLGELCDETPENPVVARVSGDEFVVILPQNSDQTELLAAQVLAQLREPFEIKNAEIHIGASIGIARYPEDATTPEELLNMADLAMYEAKRTGRDRVVSVSPELRAKWQERREVEGELRRAIEMGEIILAFQPRFSTTDLRCVSVEALARWTHPELGPVSPEIFIPIAENAGLMPALGAVVFEQAVQQCRDWQQQGISLGVSVNVSPAEFNNPNLVPQLLAVLKRFDVDAALIEIEITETMAMGDFETTQEQMMSLRAAGLKIAIDDFGTGYSNLAQLTRLPYTSMKLDMSLIVDATEREGGLDILMAVVRMAKALGHTTVAEGIETQAQYEALLSTGCDEVQGFWFGKPVAANEVLDFVFKLPPSQYA